MAAEKITLLLDSIYSNVKDPGGLGGVIRLYRAARAKNKSVRLSDVREYLHKNSTYTLHFPSRRKHKTGRTRCSWIDSDHQTDLAVLLDLKHVT